MIHYIIESTAKWIEKKTGEAKTMTSYYVKTSQVVVTMHHMTGNKDEAMKFDCKSEAKRHMKKLHWTDPNRYKILKIET